MVTIVRSWLYSHVHIITNYYTDIFLFLILENSDSSQNQHPVSYMKMGVQPALEILCMSRNLTLGFINNNSIDLPLGHGCLSVVSICCIVLCR
jgi:hypothetical protein